MDAGEHGGDDFFEGRVFDDDVFDGVLGEDLSQSAGDVGALDAEFDLGGLDTDHVAEAGEVAAGLAVGELERDELLAAELIDDAG